VLVQILARPSAEELAPNLLARLHLRPLLPLPEFAHYLDIVHGATLAAVAPLPTRKNIKPAPLAKIQQTGVAFPNRFDAFLHTAHNYILNAFGEKM
jgi:hypothetical protein